MIISGKSAQDAHISIGTNKIVVPNTNRRENTNPSKVTHVTQASGHLNSGAERITH